MHMQMTDNMTEMLDARPLTDAELVEVNGGFIFLALGLVACFEAGFLGGVLAANYSTTGNIWGDID